MYVCVCVCVLTSFLYRALLGDYRSLSIGLICENVGLFCVVFIREGMEGLIAFFFCENVGPFCFSPPQEGKVFAFFCVEKVGFFRLKVARGLLYF